MERVISHSESALPVDQQVLLHSETLAPGIALGLILRAPWLGARLFFRIAFQVRELHQLIFLHSTVQPGLLPYSWSVDDQVVLTKEQMQ